MAGIVFSKASGVADSFFGKSQYPIQMLMEQSVEAFEKESITSKLFKTVTSNQFAEKFTSATALGSFTPVGEGGAYPRTSMQEGYSKVIEPDTWKNSMAVTKEMIEDNKMLDTLPVNFIQSFGRTKEEYGALMLAGGLNASTTIYGKTCSTASADGLSLFSTAHTSITGGTSTQSNRYDEAFSADALDALECKMQGFTDNDGHVLSIQPDTIIIPNEYTLKRLVFATIGADKDPATANNGFNYQFGRWNVIIWPYLPTTFATNKYWMLMDSKYNDIYGSLMWVDRVPLSVHSYVDDNNDNNVWNGRARFGAGFNDWRGISISGVSGATDLIA